MKKILFLTGTRADYGKLKPLIKSIDKHNDFESFVFVTGMHMLKKYGYTAKEVMEENHENFYLVNNQKNYEENSEIILANTIKKFSEYIKKINPDLIVVHGDRTEALAGTLAGVFNNILVAHIEGGESSGSIDESIRHSITKLSHMHFVSNKNSAQSVIQMGENEENIYTIGSPDLDILFSGELPSIEDVKKRYNISFQEYGIFIFHSVTTEVSNIEHYCNEVIKGILDSNKNFIFILPNNDKGSQIILDKINSNNEIKERGKIFASIPFNDFLTLLKNAKCIVGNSSAGVRQAPAIPVPTINIGTRQNNRNSGETIYNISYDSQEINSKIVEIWNNNQNHKKSLKFGDGTSVRRFVEILESKKFWETSLQK